MAFNNGFVEVPTILVYFSFMLTDSVCTNLLMFRTCYVLLGYNETECTKLGTDSHTYSNFTAQLEELVQPKATTIKMVQSLIMALMAAGSCLFAGPWSDTFGRKLVFLVPLIGIIYDIIRYTGYGLHYLLLVVYSAVPTLSPWYMLICFIPVMFTGGATTYTSAVLAYIADITPQSRLHFRMSVFDATLYAGTLLGSVLSSYVFHWCGYAGTYGIAAACFGVALVFATTIADSLPNRQRHGRLRNLFRCSHLRDLAAVVVKRRNNYNRAILIVAIVLLTVLIIMLNAESAINFMYFRVRFHWSLKDYTLYSAAVSFALIVGTLVGVHVLQTLLRLPPVVILTIGFAALLLTSLLQGLATTSTVIYIAGGIKSLGGVLSPIVRSLITKLISADEIGKVFAAIVTSETLFGLLGPPLYTVIYNTTLDTDPAIYNFVSTVIYFVEILLIGSITILQRIDPTREHSILEASNNNHHEPDEEQVNGIIENGTLPNNK